MNANIKLLFPCKLFTFVFFWALCGNNAMAESYAPLAKKVCGSCHGVDGNSINPTFPKLAGLSKDYLVAQLNNFKTHQRTEKEAQDYMWGLVRNFDDATILGIAEYFSQQVPTATATNHSQNVAQGKTIYEQGKPEKGLPACATCHGLAAEGVSIFPRLAGQHQHYLELQLHNFSVKQRPNWEIMQPIAEKLSDGDAKAVTAYLESL